MVVDARFPALIVNLRENESHLDMLVDQISRRVGVIPFVGAGLSAQLGFPLWTTFLRDQAILAQKQQETDSMLRAGRYEEAAQELMDSRGSRRLNDAISTTFSRTPDILALGAAGAHYIPDIADDLVVTTNFDRVLEAAFAQAQRPFLNVLWGARVSQAVEVLTTGDRTLI